MNTQLWYSSFTKLFSRWSGKPITFLASIGLILMWIITGPLFNFSDTWQLVINTTTTIITFIMVFVIQNTQNRDTEAIQVKLDELIRVTQGAHNTLLDLEDLDDEQIDQFKKNYESLAKSARIKSKEDNKKNVDLETQNTER